MAIRDWVKVKDTPNTWENNISGGRIRFYKLSKGYEVAGKYPWKFYSAITNKDNVFKKKSEAKKFAIEYMRKH